ncbi:hypothetical protein AQUCO_12200006v1 [Aquilegia coerulea]|uniref:Uncharacterized protein n=1 Tax=Aquilegia coerulea TaxID=218851 RepID=A0A2G5C1S2_AQUCA|nr:hypothetical protein AQUCO_12200006v1 [Aquilegia coerulea]
MILEILVLLPNLETFGVGKFKKNLAMQRKFGLAVLMESTSARCEASRILIRGIVSLLDLLLYCQVDFVQMQCRDAS